MTGKPGVLRAAKHSGEPIGVVARPLYLSF